MKRPARSLLLLGAVLAGALAAPWLAPRRPDLQEDVAGARFLPPLTRARAVAADVRRTWIVTDLERAGDARFRARRAGREVELDAEQVRAGGPRLYLLGTDGLGRDLLSRMLHGAGHAARVAGAAVALAMLLGTAVGSAAGFLGGAWDAAVMRVVDLVMAVPRLLLYLLCAALLAPSTALLVLVLGATTWTGLARLVRAEVRSLRGREFAVAARAAGCSPLRALAVHLVPQLVPLLAVTAALRFADTVLLEAALGFMGLGAPPPAVSLGGILAEGREVPPDVWWVVLWPGLLIALMVIGLRALATRLFAAGESPSVV